MAKGKKQSGNTVLPGVENIPAKTHIRREECALTVEVEDIEALTQSAQNKIWQEVMRKTGTRFEVWHSRGSPVTLIIRGSPENAVKARAMVNKLTQKEITIYVTVPQDHLPAIIGSGGKTIQRVQDETMTRVKVGGPKKAGSDLPEETDEKLLNAPAGMVNIRLFGTTSNVSQARERIQELSRERAKNSWTELRIPQDFHQLVRGKQNANTKGLEKDLGVKIYFPRTDLASDDPNTDRVSIRGEDKDVKEASRRLKAIYDTVQQTTTRVDVKVAKKSHKFIIGPNGRTVRDIGEQTGCVVDVPAFDDPSEVIVIRGEHASIVKAMEVIMERAKHTQDSITIDKKCRRFILGTKGATLNGITSSTDTQIRIPMRSEDDDQSQPDVVTIEGKFEDVENAKAQLNKIASSVKTVRLDIPRDHHSYVIGAKGAKVSKIMRETKTSIDFPPTDMAEDIVTVTGMEGAGLDEACDQIRALSTEKAGLPIVVDVEIPPEHHAYVIGPKGAKINEIMKDTDCNIHFPNNKDGKESDPSKASIVQIRGHAENIEKAKAAMLALSKEKANLPIQITLDYDNAYIRLVQPKLAEITDGEANWFVRPDLTQAKVRVHPDKVDAVTKKFNALVKGFVTETVEIPAANHAYVIGAKGARVAEIREKCDVLIQFPDAKNEEGEKIESDTVTLMGTKKDIEVARKMLLKSSKDKDDTPIIETFDLPKEAHKVLASNDGHFKNQLCDKYEITLFLPRMKDDTEKVRIRARKSEMENLIETVKNWYEKDVYKLDVKIPHAHHSFVIGAKGSKVTEIMQDTKTVIEFPGNNSDSDIVKVFGEESSCKDARRALLALSDEKANQPVSIEFKIPYRNRNFLLGAEGRLTKAVAQQTSTTISLGSRKNRRKGGKGKGKGAAAEDGEKAAEATTEDKPAEKEAEKEFETVHVRGVPRDVEKAKAKILKLIDSITTVTIQIPHKSHTYVKGTNNNRLNSISRTTGTKITFPANPAEDSDGPFSDDITIEGVKEHIDMARKQLQRLAVEKENQPVVSEIEISNDAHRFLIGAKGARVSKVMEQFGVHIKFIADSDKVRIRGPPNVHEATKARLEELLAQYEEIKARDEERKARAEAGGDENGTDGAGEKNPFVIEDGENGGEGEGANGNGDGSAPARSGRGDRGDRRERREQKPRSELDNFFFASPEKKAKKEKPPTAADFPTLGGASKKNNNSAPVWAKRATHPVVVKGENNNSDGEKKKGSKGKGKGGKGKKGGDASAEPAPAQ